MDFKHRSAQIAASMTILVARFIQLLFTPYKTMRQISEEKDYLQIVLILLSVGAYFWFANIFRDYNYPPKIIFLVTAVHYLLTVFYFYFFSRYVFSKKTSIRPFLFTFAYGLIPTLVWFITNSVLFVILPPPRTLSLFGKAFSVLYIVFSLGMLMWKIILSYLALRFSSKLNFYQILYMVLFYLAFVAPYTLFMYSLKLFRVPFF